MTAENTKISNSGGLWLGWIGIILGIIGFFWQPIFLGITSVILGIIGLQSPQKDLNIAAIVVGAISFIIGLF